MVSKVMLGRIKAVLPQSVVDELVKIRLGAQMFREVRGRHPRECPICGFRGLFWAAGHQPVVMDARCPGCRSIGRHRQHQLLMSRHADWLDGKAVLHFSPEPCFDDTYAKRLRETNGQYLRAEYNPQRGETKVDVQTMQFDDASFDTVIVHNVLEHVPDDRKALAELRRVVRADGRVILSIPMIDAWGTSYEDKRYTSESDRDLHFNQYDHLRLYGRDVYDLFDEAAFTVEPYVASEPEVSRYGLERGETIFVCAPKPGG
jgi:SAM-dependent methyltransferase